MIEFNENFIFYCSNVEGVTDGTVLADAASVQRKLEVTQMWCIME